MYSKENGKKLSKEKGTQKRIKKKVERESLKLMDMLGRCRRADCARVDMLYEVVPLGMPMSLLAHGISMILYSFSYIYI